MKIRINRAHGALQRVMLLERAMRATAREEIPRARGALQRVMLLERAMRATAREEIPRAHGALQRVAVLAFGMAVTAALAQVPPTLTQPHGVADYQDMMLQYEAAQAAAHRPGDEVLTCDAIRIELEATVNSPAMQDYITSASEQAQRDMAYAQAAMAGVAPGVPATTVPPVPAGDPAQQAAERASAHQQQIEQLNAIMPLLMRAQRLSELAALKACAWLSEGGYSLPTPEPAVPFE